MDGVDGVQIKKKFLPGSAVHIIKLGSAENWQSLEGAPPTYSLFKNIF
jgi:hypothetical protein